MQQLLLNLASLRTGIFQRARHWRPELLARSLESRTDPWIGSWTVGVELERGQFVALGVALMRLCTPVVDFVP